MQALLPSHSAQHCRTWVLFLFWVLWQQNTTTVEVFLQCRRRASLVKYFWVVSSEQFSSSQHFSSPGFHVRSVKSYSWFWCAALCWRAGGRPKAAFRSFVAVFRFGLVFLVTALLMSNSFWITLSDSLSVVPLATVVLVTFISRHCCTWLFWTLPFDLLL